MRKNPKGETEKYADWEIKQEEVEKVINEILNWKPTGLGNLHSF